MPHKKTKNSKTKNSQKKSEKKRGRTAAAIAAFPAKHRLISAISALTLLTAAVLASLYFGTSPLKMLPGQNGMAFFGAYPQTRVRTEDLLGGLNGLTPEWNKFDDCFAGQAYYGTMEKTDSMLYADVEYKGELYRGVRFETYRPAAITDGADAQTSYQDENGYTPGNVYWFRWEPICWYVADEKKQLLLSAKVLDAVQFNDSFYWIDRNSDGDVDPDGEFSARPYLALPANLYKTASIRRWLNGTFCDAAFSAVEQRRIKSTLHRADESAGKTRYGLHSITSDRVWLFSAAEALAWEKASGDANVVFPQATDYAMCRGAYSGTLNERTSAWWWTRSAGDFSGDVISIVENEMVITSDRQFPQAYAVGGVRCAIRLRNAVDGTEG